MNILGNSFSWGLGGYENGQFGHKGSNWKTENAWDLNTQSDTDVYSITDGTVTKIKTIKMFGLLKMAKPGKNTSQIKFGKSVMKHQPLFLRIKYGLQEE